MRVEIKRCLSSDAGFSMPLPGSLRRAASTPAFLFGLACLTCRSSLAASCTSTEDPRHTWTALPLAFRERAGTLLEGLEPLAANALFGERAREALAPLPAGAIEHIKYPVVVDGRAFAEATGFAHELGEVETMAQFAARRGRLPCRGNARSRWLGASSARDRSRCLSSCNHSSKSMPARPFSAILVGSLRVLRTVRTPPGSCVYWRGAPRTLKETAIGGQGRSPVRSAVRLPVVRISRFYV